MQSISSTTYSYIIQSIISCNRNLLSSLFIELKETNVIFEPNIRIQEILFIPINIIVKVFKSDKGLQVSN